jgi:deoxyribonuclease-4
MAAKYIGPHVHTAGGVYNAPANADAVGAGGFGLFTKNQRQWKAKPLETETIDAFKTNMELYGYKPEAVLVHGSYLINIGSPDCGKRAQSVEALIDEVRRCAALGLTLLNIHPGSGAGVIGADECAALIAESLNAVLDETQTAGVSILLEAMSGQGSALGGRFEELAEIIDKVADKARLGVCIDTCHIFTAGYDIRDAEGYEAAMREFDRVVGLKYVRGLHLNDAKNALGSRVDRHESIGKGHIGINAFRMLMEDGRFDGLPCVLETPREELWADEVKTLQEMSVR